MKTYARSPEALYMQGHRAGTADTKELVRTLANKIAYLPGSTEHAKRLALAAKDAGVCEWDPADIPAEFAIGWNLALGEMLRRLEKAT